MGRSARLVLLAAAAWAASVLPAAAHRIDLSAHAHDGVIHGEAKDDDGGPVAGALVTVRDGRGRELGQTTTDAQGAFRFTPTQRTDHHFLVNAGGGHAAECVVAAKSLPAAMPTPEAAHEHTTDSKPAEEHDHAATGHDEPSVEPLAQQIDALRGAVERLERATQFRDVLGGIGFILGIAGVAMYFLAGRKKGG